MGKKSFPCFIFHLFSVISGKFTGTISWDFFELRKHIPLTLTLRKRPLQALHWMGPTLKKNFIAFSFGLEDANNIQELPCKLDKEMFFLLLLQDGKKIPTPALGEKGSGSAGCCTSLGAGLCGATKGAVGGESARDGRS